MAKIKLITDSACDLTPELEKQNDIRILNFKVAMGDNSYISRVDFDTIRFYELLEAYEGLPSTSQITMFEYEEVFREYYEQGYDAVIYVSINKNASGTYNNAIMAKNALYESIPEAKGKFEIYIIDSRSYTAAYGFPLTQAAEQIRRGAGVKEVVAYFEDWFEKVVIYFAPYTLKYAKKSGRIPSAAAFVGEVLGLRPIMQISNGEITTYDKVRGDKAVIPKILEHTVRNMIPQTPYCVIYGKDEVIRDVITNEATKIFGYPPSGYYQIGAAIAINAGPVVAGIMFKKNS